MAQDRPEDEQVQVKPVKVYPLATVAGWAIGVVLVLWFFEPVRFVFLGILAACCLAAVLQPVRDRLPGPRGFRAVVAGLIPVVIAILVVTGISYFLTIRIEEQIARWPETRAGIDALLASVSYRLGMQTPITVYTLVDQTYNYFSYGGGAGIASATASTLSKVLIGLAFLFFGSIYLLAARHDELVTPVLKGLPPRRRLQVNAAIIDLEQRLRWWAIGAAISMTVVAVVTGVGYTIIGLQMALPLALVAGLSELIPTLGPIVSFLVAIVFAATQGPGMMLGVAIIYIMIQILESYILIPLVMKRTIDMPPVVTLFTVVLWGRIFGPAGLVLALPINLMLVSFADRLLRRTD